MRSLAIVALLAAGASAQIIATRQGQDTVNLFEMVSSNDATLTALETQVNAQNEMLSNMMEQASLNNDVIQAAIMGTTKTAALLQAIVQKQMMNISYRTMLANERVLALQSNVQRLAAENSAVVSTASSAYDNTRTAVESQINSYLSSAESGFNTLSRDMLSRLTSANESLMSTTTSQLQPVLQMATALQRSHYLSPSTPVYRWTMFHVYSNNNIGWFDGNNVRYFGGSNPSTWGDGNNVVWNMDSRFSVVAKLINRYGVGSVAGATVCSEGWYLYSSTDTKYCIALFRIKNSQNSGVGFRWNWQGTGWSGWGNYQSASVNGNQNWAANCDWWCDQTWDVTFPAARTSTAIFANGMSAPNGYCCGKVIETTFMGFNGLTLPTGLSYVDDMDVMGMTEDGWR